VSTEDMSNLEISMEEIEDDLSDSDKPEWFIFFWDEI
jgi:hypothetical protein